MGQLIEFLGYLGVWISNFIFGSGGIDGKFPAFGSFFSYMVLLWILEGIGYIIRIIFGWQAEDAAADADGRFHSTPNHRR